MQFIQIHQKQVIFYLGHVLFFSMFLVTHPRSFWLKTKQNKKKTEDHKIRACWPKVSCAQHLHVTVALADSIEWTLQLLHGYWEEEEELSPSP